MQKAELRANAVSFGSNMFVGGASFSGYSAPASSDLNGRLSFFKNGRTRFMYSGVYLQNTPGNFTWTASGFGKSIQGVVSYKGFGVGRIRFRNGKIYLGRISKGFLFYDVGNKESRTATYEVLVHTPEQDE